MTILENLSIARARTHGLGFRLAIDKELRDYAADAIKKLNLGLENRLTDKVGLLSGGQRQALSLFMASMGKTEVLLLDEHTAALDPKTASFVLNLTKEVVSTMGITTIMVTHSMQQALAHGDRTIMFHQGNIVLDVAGEERANMKVADLLELFRRDQGEELADDALLLG